MLPLLSHTSKHWPTFHLLLSLFELFLINSLQSLLFFLLSSSLRQCSCFNILKVYLWNIKRDTFKTIDTNCGNGSCTVLVNLPEKA